MSVVAFSTFHFLFVTQSLLIGQSTDSTVCHIQDEPFAFCSSVLNSYLAHCSLTFKKNPCGPQL